LFDLVLNATKTDADLLFNLPFSTNSDDQLLDLMAYTLGLRLSKEKYTSAQLRSICSVATKMMRAKGSLKAIELLCTALIRADSVAGSFSTEMNDTGTELIIFITNLSTCKDILHEILPYIVPAGVVFNIKEMTEFDIKVTTVTVSNHVVRYGTLYSTSDLKPDLEALRGDSSTGPYNFTRSTDSKEVTTTFIGDLSNVVIAAPTAIDKAASAVSTTESTLIFDDEEED
jgi:hypothetical protein